MRHLRYENSHTGNPIAEIKAEIDTIFLRTKRMEILFDFIFGYDKMGQIPFYTHKENTILPVHIQLEIKNITAIDIDKIGND